MQTTGHSNRTLTLAIAATQVSFSLTTIAGTIAISALRDDPKTDLAFMSSVLLLNGLTRTLFGLNLGLRSRESTGAAYPAFLLIVVLGIPFVSLGYGWWVASAWCTAAYEFGRSTLSRSESVRSLRTVIVADAVWLLPFALVFSQDVPMGAIVGAGAGLGCATTLIDRRARVVLRDALTPGTAWVRERSAQLRRSAFESLSSVGVPLGVVAVLTAMSRFDDVNALRAVGQAISPMGSAVAVLVLMWPRLASSRRRLAANVMILAPFLLIPAVAVAPGLFSLLSADSPHIWPYALGWAAFGTAQTRVALQNADGRIGERSRFIPLLIIVPMLIVALLFAALSADDWVTRLAVSTVVCIPWIVGFFVDRQLDRASTLTAA